MRVGLVLPPSSSLRPSSLLPLILSLLWLGPGCYEQPAIPRDKPLRCASQLEGECPPGFRCTARGLCANINCQSDDECPLGLVCTERTGCDIAGDAGADATDGAPETGILPGGGGDAIIINQPPDAGAGSGDAPAPLDQALPDVPTTLDLGGNS